VPLLALARVDGVKPTGSVAVCQRPTSTGLNWVARACVSLGGPVRAFTSAEARGVCYSVGTVGD